MAGLRVNIGCGEYPAAGWVNVDLHDDGPLIDVSADVRDLTAWDDGTVERVYCGHVMEHLEYGDLDAALSELHRVLRDDGELLIVGPDIMRAHQQRQPASLIAQIIGGEGRWPGDEHRWPSCEALMAHAAWQFFVDVESVDVATVPDDWPIVSRAPWQFALRCLP